MRVQRALRRLAGKPSCASAPSPAAFFYSCVWATFGRQSPLPRTTHREKRRGGASRGEASEECGQTLHTPHAHPATHPHTQKKPRCSPSTSAASQQPRARLAKVPRSFLLPRRQRSSAPSSQRPRSWLSTFPSKHRARRPCVDADESRSAVATAARLTCTGFQLLVLPPWTTLSLVLLPRLLCFVPPPAPCAFR